MTSGSTPRPKETHERSGPSVSLAIAVEAGDWGDAGAIEALAETALAAAVRDLSEREGQPFPDIEPEVSLVLADDAMMADINGQWRNQPKPTNVLSFPAFPLVPGGQPGPMLGDIILARGTIEREALELDKPVESISRTSSCTDFFIFSATITLKTTMPRKWKRSRLAF
jgi:probable rRNA maturation factor